MGYVQATALTGPMEELCEAEGTGLLPKVIRLVSFSQ